MRRSILGVVLVAGCTLRSPVGISDDDASHDLVLAPGAVVEVDAAYRMSFGEVKGDSRCPVDVVCAWQGDATVEIALWIGSGPSYPFTLNLNSSPQSVTWGGYEVTFIALSPEPHSGTVIKPEDYRARFRIRPQPVRLGHAALRPWVVIESENVSNGSDSRGSGRLAIGRLRQSPTDSNRRDERQARDGSRRGAGILEPEQCIAPGKRVEDLEVGSDRSGPPAGQVQRPSAGHRGVDADVVT